MIDDCSLKLNAPLEDKLFWQMAIIRELESRLLQLHQQNEIFGTTHTCLGQESSAVGIVNAIDRYRDTIWSSHRCHGHFIAYCGQVTALLAEVMGRTGGACRGRGGSQHLSWGRFHSSGVQGGLVPLALGTAMAGRDDGEISIVFLGDGTMGEGILYEGLNLASLWSLPVLFVVEDNGIAQTTPSELGVSGSIADRAKPFGIRSFSTQEAGAVEIHALAQEVVGFVRGEGRPAWLHLQTVRLGPHSKGDDTRSEEELVALRERDPLKLMECRVRNHAEFYAEAREIVDQALDRAKGMPVACE